MVKDSAIPTKSRDAVRRRDRDRCARCGGRGSEWHHRRSRSVRGDHRHCPCNGVLLCGACHRWAHANPQDARDTGFIVSRYEPSPFTIPVHTITGWASLDCDGQISANRVGAQPEEVD